MMPQVSADRFDDDLRPRVPYHCLSGDSVTPLATFGVLRETILIWAVLICTVTFRQRISMTRWVAILGIFVGCTLNQVPALVGSRFNYGIFERGCLPSSMLRAQVPTSMP